MATISGSWHSYFHDFKDFSRTAGHHHDTVCEVYSFVHTVSYEKNGLTILLPYPQQFLLKQDPSMCVQSAERLVHEQDVRVVGK